MHCIGSASHIWGVALVLNYAWLSYEGDAC